MPAFSFRKVLKYGIGGGSAALLILGMATCSGATTSEACPTPAPGSQQAGILSEAQQKTRFDLEYPCYLPNNQVLESHSVIGDPGKQRSEFVFAGTFDLALRQSQVPPPREPDPTGASRRTVQLFDGVQASFIERTDGTSEALYHLYWERNGFFWELQAYGPYQQQRLILQVARSLQ
jgi:hypothetical protein